jgi:CspA family cold shock protein
MSEDGNTGRLEAMMTGTIRTLRVDKGFGFIKDDGGKDYFFHQSAVYGEGLQDLREGDSVEFDVGQGPKGPRAETVRRTSTSMAHPTRDTASTSSPVSGGDR